MSNRILVWAVNLGAVCLAVFGGWVLYQVISDAEEETVAVAVGEPVTAANRSDDVSAAVGARSAGGLGPSVPSAGALPTLAPSEFTPITPTPIPPTPEPTATPDVVEPEVELLSEVVEITPTPEGVRVPTPAPTVDAAVPTEGTAAQTGEVSAEPTAEPTAAPTAEPTAEPTSAPTEEPTPQPTAEPTATVDAVVVSTVTPTPSATPSWTEGTAPVGTFWVAAADGLTVRDNPGGSSIETLSHGSQVTSTGLGAVTARSWVQISAPLAGWVAAEFLSVTEPDALPTGPGPVSGSGPGQTQMALLRECESGSNYAINTGNGYFGAYQFSAATWDDVAARYLPQLVGVLPSNASPADQDAMMIALYSEQGFSPWPGCRTKLGLP